MYMCKQTIKKNESRMYVQESKLLYDKTMSLNTLCKRLGMPTKTASGKEAVYMAEQGRWDELEQYCRQDTVLTLSAAASLLPLVARV